MMAAKELPEGERTAIVKAVVRCREDGLNGRRAAVGAREKVWADNVDLAWNRFDFSGRAAWQSQHAMPEGSLYLDRWSAALREALMLPEGWYTVKVEGAGNAPLDLHIKAFLDVWLARCGTDALGAPLPYASVFEEQVKLAGMMAACASVGWDNDRVVVRTVDPRELVLDPTGRGLWRVWTTTVDWHALQAMAKELGWDEEAAATLTTEHDEEVKHDRERLAERDESADTARRHCVLHYFYGTLLDDRGEPLADGRVHCVVGGGNTLLAAPRANPYWHGQDWIVFTPPIHMPLSLYGKSYMETFAPIARLFVDFTNVLVDAGYFAAMSAFAARPEMLRDPEQLNDGVYPGKTFIVEDGKPAEFLAPLQLGTPSPATLNTWQALKSQLREATSTNDIDLGQVPGKGDITATEITEVKQSGTALLRSIANTLETRMVERHLDLIFRTALQHFEPTDELAARIGPEAVAMFDAQREALAKSHITFEVRGISGLIERAARARGLLSVLQIVAQNEPLTQVFLQKVDLGKLLDQMFRLQGWNLADFAPDPSQLFPAGAPIDPTRGGPIRA